jgi:hypothetical protein
MELANLVLIAYHKNKICLECHEEGSEEPEQLFPGRLNCNADPNFDEQCPGHFSTDPYEVLAWLWHTDRPIGVQHMLRTIPFGFIAANHASKELFIVLRGTITTDEWRNNLITRPSSLISGSGDFGMVHEGFNKIFSLDYQDRLHEHKSFLTRIGRTIGTYEEPPSERRFSIKEVIRDTVINGSWMQQGYRIFITGHSLGGALAMLAGFLLLSYDKEGYSPLLSICTFGAPRVGNQAFGRWFNAVEVVRYVNSEDTVPTVPPPTAKVFGTDMNETNNEQVRARRQKGYEAINDTFGATKGAMKEETNLDDELAKVRAFVHIGETRCFTLNKGSISYNHNMPVTYREGIKLI